MDIIGFGLKAYPKMANIKPRAAEITVKAVASNVPSSGKYGTASKMTKAAITKQTRAKM
jgi:hypothetical protein